MNIEAILNTQIENIDVVYGGVRGTTLSSRHNIRHWQIVVDSGVRAIIELRDDDYSDHLCKMCEKSGLATLPFQWIATVFQTSNNQVS